jgi:hypothetical protein
MTRRKSISKQESLAIRDALLMIEKFSKMEDIPIADRQIGSLGL